MDGYRPGPVSCRNTRRDDCQLTDRPNSRTGNKSRQRKRHQMSTSPSFLPPPITGGRSRLHTDTRLCTDDSAGRTTHACRHRIGRFIAKHQTRCWRTTGGRAGERRDGHYSARWRASERAASSAHGMLLTGRQYRCGPLPRPTPNQYSPLTALRPNSIAAGVARSPDTSLAPAQSLTT